MTNETEKAMWSCKTSDTPWTFSRLLKKAICAVFYRILVHTRFIVSIRKKTII